MPTLESLADSLRDQRRSRWTGEDLRKWRSRLGYSQTDAARVLGYRHRSAICRYENGHAAVPTRLQYLCETMEDNAALKGQI